MIAMISGHLDCTSQEFNDHYKPLIEVALQRGDSFVVGDAPGADCDAQQFLAGFDAKVTVYHMFTSPRHNAGNFPTKGGYTADIGKDAAMTDESDYDIAWIRPEKHSSVSGRVSGTEANLFRRKVKDMGK